MSDLQRTEDRYISEPLTRHQICERFPDEWVVLVEIDRVNETLDGIKVLKGIEADILADGRVDYDDEILERFDFVIGSVHSRFGMDRAAMTDRVLKALDNPHLTILGHPTGRLLLADPFRSASLAPVRPIRQ